MDIFKKSLIIDRNLLLYRLIVKYSKNYLNKRSLLSVFLIISSLFIFEIVCAQSDELILEGEQHWETYGIGGTCISGSHNLFIADVDNDNTLEILTGGFMYHLVDGERTINEAPLKLWNWNGTDIILEKSHHWEGNIRCIFVEDIEGDGEMEIFTGGTFVNATGNYPSIRIWNYDGSNMVLKTSYEGVSINSIFVTDLENDGKKEILTTGRTSYTSSSKAKLYIWSWAQKTLILKDSVEWGASNDARANSVCAYDLNNDNKVEIITAGYDNDLENSSGQLKIWHWTGQNLELKTNQEWQMKTNCYGPTNAGGVMGNTLVENLKAGDIDGDGFGEIVTGGFTYDGQKINGQICIWNFSNNDLVLETSHEWISEDITTVKAIELNDVDNDGNLDILTSGLTSVYGSFKNIDATPDAAQLRIWSYNGEKIELKHEKDWTIGDGVAIMNIDADDLDNDGNSEIVSVGCMTIDTLCDPDMRIWTLSQEQSAFPYPWLALGIIAAAVPLAAFLLKKRFKDS